MLDARTAAVAGRQFNRISRKQLLELGMCKAAIERRVAAGRLVIVTEGVFAVAPVLDHDDWGRWMGATLTAPETFLCRQSAACAWGSFERESKGIEVARPGSGGPRHLSGVTVYRSSTLENETTFLRGVPITGPLRTLLDLACCVSEKALAKAVRDFVRLGHTTVYALGDWLGSVRHRRGAARLARAVARYRGLPLERARSGAEIRALELLREAGIELPRLNVAIAGEEADLSWPRHKLIIEIDGRPWHQDEGEDTRKETEWRNAGWEVLRLDSENVYQRPDLLIALALEGLTSDPASRARPIGTFREPGGYATGPSTRSV